MGRACHLIRVLDRGVPASYTPGVPIDPIAELGARAKAASRVLATASTEVKDAALLAAADLLLDRHAEILAANADDVAAAEAAGQRADASSTACGSPTPACRRWPTACASVAAPARPGRRGRRRLDPAQRPAGPAGPGAPRRRGDHLREPPQRHQRRLRPVPEGRATPPSCGAPRAPSARTSPSPRRCGRGWPRPACRTTRSCWWRTPRHEAAVEFMRLRESIDVLIPRGGPSLIRSVLDNATVPYVIDGDGNCHVYVDAVRRPRDGRRHRRERQDAAAVGVQRRRDAPRAPQRRRHAPHATWRRGSRASSWSATTPPARSSAIGWRRSPPTRTTPPSSST